MVRTLNNKVIINCTGDIAVDTDVNSDNKSYYEGNYNITPKVNEVIELNTDGKLLKEKINVNKIPYKIIDNDNTGKKFIVGEETDYIAIDTSNINEVLFGSSTILNLSDDTVTPDKLLKGVIAHDSFGRRIVGTSEITYEDDTLYFPVGFSSVVVGGD